MIEIIGEIREATEEEKEAYERQLEDIADELEEMEAVLIFSAE